jgi:hypothetical protein
VSLKVNSEIVPPLTDAILNSFFYMMRGIFLFSSIALFDNCSANDSTSNLASQKECSLLQVSLPNSDRGVKRVVSLVADQAEGTQKPNTNVRPGFRNDKVDVVEFGILIKKWYGIDFTGGTFTVDAVIGAKWQDPRTARLIPGNAPSTRLAIDDADKVMWLPDLSATNTAHDGVDVISSSVLIQKNGTVTKVQRALLTLKQGYQTADFPFDTQAVTVKVASTIYMRDEVQLRPTEDTSLWGCSADLFGNTPWNVVNASLTSINEDDGLLQKSRGILTITVTREASQYMSSIFVPTVVLLCMTWCSLWLPIATPYIMPRIAVSVISILCMMSLMNKANTMIPATGNNSWMSQYLETCVLLQFILMVLNALILSIEHRSGGNSIATGLDNELIIVFPILTFIVMLAVAISYFTVARLLITVSLIGYVGYIFYRSRTQTSAPASQEK